MPIQGPCDLLLGALDPMRYEMNQDPHAVVAEGLGKRYREQRALRDFELAVPTGSVLGLLGHNGAGNPTAIPSGSAWPLEHPVVASVAWCVAILAVVVPLTLRASRKRTTG